MFDAVINAMLCRAFPDPRGIALFTDFYAADEVPAALLRPADGWEPSRLGRPASPSRALIKAGHPRLADVHRALYSPGGVSYEELRDALLEACPPAQAAEVALLGDHGAGGLMGGDLEARAPVLLDVVRQIVEEWPQPPGADHGPVPRDAHSARRSRRPGVSRATGHACARCSAGRAASPTAAPSARPGPSRPRSSPP